MLSCCDADGEILSVPEFFAVGKTFRALFWCAVKGGGHCQCLNISAIFKVHLCRVPRLSVFINHLTLPLNPHLQYPRLQKYLFELKYFVQYLHFQHFLPFIFRLTQMFNLIRQTSIAIRCNLSSYCPHDPLYGDKDNLHLLIPVP